MAAEMFAGRPFHEVRLEDVAAAAKVGKGTLYIYFKSKEDLYFSLAFEGWSRLTTEVRVRIAAEPTAWARLRRMVEGLVEFAGEYPHVFELVRRAIVPTGQVEWRQTRQELTRITEEIIREGNARGEMDDPRPDLTALFVPGLVRSAMLFAPPDLRGGELVEQIMRLLRHGVAADSVKHPDTKEEASA